MRCFDERRLNSQALYIVLILLMVILLMTHRQSFLHELFPSLGIHADAHGIAGRYGIVAEDLSYLVEQSDGRIQKKFRRKLLPLLQLRGSSFICKRRIFGSLRRSFFKLKSQTFRFLDDRVLDCTELFLMREWMMLPGQLL